MDYVYPLRMHSCMQLHIAIFSCVADMYMNLCFAIGSRDGHRTTFRAIRGANFSFQLVSLPLSRIVSRASMGNQPEHLCWSKILFSFLSNPQRSLSLSRSLYERNQIWGAFISCLDMHINSFKTVNHVFHDCGAIGARGNITLLKIPLWSERFKIAQFGCDECDENSWITKIESNIYHFGTLCDCRIRFRSKFFLFLNVYTYNFKTFRVGRQHLVEEYSDCYIEMQRESLRRHSAYGKFACRFLGASSRSKYYAHSRGSRWATALRLDTQRMYVGSTSRRGSNTSCNMLTLGRRGHELRLHTYLKMHAFASIYRSLVSCTNIERPAALLAKTWDTIP